MREQEHDGTGNQNSLELVGIKEHKNIWGHEKWLGKGGHLHFPCFFGHHPV